MQRCLNFTYWRADARPSTTHHNRNKADDINNGTTKHNTTATKNNSKNKNNKNNKNNNQPTNQPTNHSTNAHALVTVFSRALVEPRIWLRYKMLSLHTHLLRRMPSVAGTQLENCTCWTLGLVCFSSRPGERIHGETTISAGCVGNDDVPWTCAHAGYYATVFVLSWHIFWMLRLSWGGDDDVPCPCTHGGC